MLVAEVNGLVNSVQRVSRGSEMLAAATVGATTLFVDSAEDFDDAGGDLDINGVRYAYTSSNIDLDTITLATPGLTASVAVGDGVYVVLGGQIAMDHIAYTTLGDGDPAEVIIPFAERVFWPEGDYPDPVPVVLSADLTSIEAVTGRSPVINLMDTFRVDSTTGQVTIIGEIGTSPPGEIGVFLFSNKFSYAGSQVLAPTVQFNTGAAVVQPRIEGNTSSAAGLFLSSGRDNAERESKLSLNNNEALLYVQDAPGGAIGSYVRVQNDRISALTNVGGANSALFNIGEDLEMRTRIHYGTGTIYSGRLNTYEAGSDVFSFIGLQSADLSLKQGLTVRLNVSTRINSGGPLEVTTQGGGAWRPVSALSFDVMSDRNSKRDLATPTASALDAIRSAPTYEFSYDNDEDDTRRLGVMAQDLPDILIVDMAPEDAEHFAAGMKGVSLPQQVALLWQAISELDVELDAVTGLRPTKPTRAKRRTK